jgi:hypothetical protein
MRFSSVCESRPSGFRLDWQVVMGLLAWATCLTIAATVRHLYQLQWSDLAPATLLALSPVAATVVMALASAGGWPILAAGGIVGASILLPALLIGRWVPGLFDSGGGLGWFVVMLLAYQDKPRHLLGVAVVLGLVIVAVSFIL